MAIAFGSFLAAVASAVWAWRSHRVMTRAEHRASRPRLELSLAPTPDMGPELLLRCDSDMDRIVVSIARDETGVSGDLGPVGALSVDNDHGDSVTLEQPRAGEGRRMGVGKRAGLPGPPKRDGRTAALAFRRGWRRRRFLIH